MPTILFDAAGRKHEVPDANLDLLLETGLYSKTKPKPPAADAPAKSDK